MGDQRKNGAEGDDAQPAHLDQQQQDQLPGQVEGLAGQDNRQPGHAQGTGGHEQAVDQAECLARLVGQWQAEQETAQQDGQRERERDQAGGRDAGEQGAVDGAGHGRRGIVPIGAAGRGVRGESGWKLTEAAAKSREPFPVFYSEPRLGLGFSPY